MFSFLLFLSCWHFDRKLDNQLLHFYQTINLPWPHHISDRKKKEDRACFPNVSQHQNYKHNYTSGTCKETSSLIPTSLHPGKCERSSLCSIPPCSSVHGTIILYNVVVPLSGTAFDCMITCLKYTSFHFIFHRRK